MFRMVVFSVLVLGGCASASRAPSVIPKPPLAPTPGVCMSCDMPPPVCPVVEPPRPPLPITVPCEDVEHDNSGTVKLTLATATFADMPHWGDDNHAEALPAFLASCEQLKKLPDNATVGSGPFGGRAWQWRRACVRARRLAPGDQAAARAFFEKEFRPYAAHGTKGPHGKMTGVLRPGAARFSHAGRKISVSDLHPAQRSVVDPAEFLFVRRAEQKNLGAD